MIKLQTIIDEDQSLQEAISRDNQEIRMQQEHWVIHGESQWNGRNRISLVEYLKAHGIVEQNATHQKKIWDRKWTESVRWVNDPQ